MAEKLAKHLVGAMGGLLALTYGKQLIVFIISLFPILELRGGMIAASLLGLDPVQSYIICIIGNLIPIPFILILFNRFFEYLRNSKIGVLNAFGNWLDKKIQKNRSKIESVGFWGLVLFVGVPLPGTGAWTGCMIATALEMDKKKAFLSALLGVLMASVIMMILSFGVIGKVV